MGLITTTTGGVVNVECIGCSIAKDEVQPIGGIVKETGHFILANDFEYPIRGFLIIGSKRHFQGFADFTQEEKKDFIDLFIEARKALSDVLDIRQITVIEEEKTRDSHFHTWLFPWHEWMQKIGSGITYVRPIMRYAKENNSTKEAIDQIIADSQKLRQYLAATQH